MQVIGSRIFYLAVTEADLPKEEDKLAQFVTLEQAFHMLNQRNRELRENTKYFEVCKGCKTVLDYLLTMRKDQLKNMKDEVEGIFKLPYLEEGEEHV
jgi:hypothetical protein